MKTLIAAAILLCSYRSFAQSNYENAWKAINQNDRPAAEKLLATIPASDPAYTDAYMTGLYLKIYNGKEKTITDFSKVFFPATKNPYPYIYALWFNAGVTGEYGKKIAPNQLTLLDQLIADEKAPGTLRAAANYQKGMHYLFSNDLDKTQKYYNQLGNIRSWQYVGPFENLSQTGIYKNYGPLEHPEPTAVFKSLSNADIKWFTPTNEVNDGWTPTVYQFNNSTAVVYFQNFVNSDKEQTVLCNIGVSGAIKVWINDELVMMESKERVTELDTYTVQCKLKKGTNRVLVELGFSNLSYPNFSLRFTDDKYKSIDGITGSSANASYTKFTGPGRTYNLIPPFAETYFKDQISRAPKNLVNYLLLADVYLRNKKIIEARNLMSDGLALAPENSLLRMKLVEVLLKEESNTLVQQEIEKIKLSDPESLPVLEIKIKDLIAEEKYEDAQTLLDKRINLYGEDITTDSYKIVMLVHEKKYEDMVKIAEKVYHDYPNNGKLMEMMYNIKKEVYKDNKGAMKVYENYMRDNYDYSIYSQYADKLSAAGNNDKALDIKERLAKDFPYSPGAVSTLANYFFTIKRYDKSEEYIKKALALAPYNEFYWEKLGDIAGEKKDNAAAMDAYTRSLEYNPNQYDIINKIRQLTGKKEMYKIFPEVDVNQAIKEDVLPDAISTEYGYYYILNQQNVILYTGGASEVYNDLIVKITSEKGVDVYKESTIGYGNSQDLLIEKSEIIKKNKTKIEGERNGNQIVFTNLEVGDVVHFKYRLQSYSYGRFAKEYWDKFVLDDQIYTNTTRFNLLAPASMKINYVINNSTIQPVITNIENLKQYSWEVKKAEPLKDEPLMPRLVDVAPVLHISTLNKWSEISSWYSDVVNNKADEDFEVMALYNKLFPVGQTPMSQFKKAKIIYEYIESNIRYSSVSFRQSAFVPQRPSATLTTRLGDCKDLSSLFVTLAHMAGINAQMVLVDTRDNGQKEMILPSVEFNHCIAKAMLDNKPYYIELTDNYLPFTSLPNNLNGAAILEIPSKNLDDKTEIQFLKAVNRTKDMIKRSIDIHPSESDLDIQVKVARYGRLSSVTRNQYLNIDNKKQVETMEKSIAGGYKNNVKMQKVSFTDLEKLNDSVAYSYSYKVKNEISEIGSLSTFKMVYPDVVASLDNFSADSRKYPIEYWSYEDTDSYETTVNVFAPAGKKFVELPASETLSFGDLKFTIQYTLKAPDKLVITRRFFNTRQQQIAPEQYAGFKTFFEKIVKAEQRFIAYK